MLLLGCSQPPPQGLPPVTIRVATAEQQAVPIVIETIGRVRPDLNIELRPQVTGRLLATHVKAGDSVKKGDLIYTIDPALYIADLNKTKAQLALDEATLNFNTKKYERYQDLIKKEFVSQLTAEELANQVSVSQAQVDLDRAAVQQAQINYDYTFVRSPVDGMVGNFVIDPGNTVTANNTQALVRIVTLKPATIYFNFPQPNFLKIQHAFGTERMVFEAILPEGYSEKGIVNFIDNSFDAATGTLLLKGQIENSHYKFWPNAFIRVRVVLKVDPEAIVVPTDAILYGQKGAYLFVVKGEQAELRLVDPGEDIDGHTMIRKGVSKGEQVVTDGQVNLRDGSKVIIKS